MEQTKSKKGIPGWLKIIGGIIIVIIIVDMLSGKSDENTSTTVPQAATAQKSVPAGQPLQTDYFTFTATNPRIVKSLYIDGFSDLKKEDGNSYLIFDLSLRNTDRESRMMTAGELVVNNSGQIFKYEEPETVMAEGYGLLLDNINPGVTKHTKLVFKIPSDLKGSVEYHPSRSDDNQMIHLMAL